MILWDILFEEGEEEGTEEDQQQNRYSRSMKRNRKIRSRRRILKMMQLMASRGDYDTDPGVIMASWQ